MTITPTKELDGIIEEKESKRLTKKAAFISKAPILYDTNIITIPEGAMVMRTRSGYVLFFRSLPDNAKNGFVEIPNGVRFVQYLHFAELPHNTKYGNPTFYDKHPWYQE